MKKALLLMSAIALQSVAWGQDAPANTDTRHANSTTAVSLANVPAPVSQTTTAALNTSPTTDILAVQNATLLRENDTLKAQVEVLTHERTGQIFLYGALVAIVCFGLGIGLGVFIKRRSF